MYLELYTRTKRKIYPTPLIEYFTILRSPYDGKGGTLYGQSIYCLGVTNNAEYTFSYLSRLA